MLQANPQVNEEVVSAASPMNQTSKHAGKVLGQNLDLKEILYNSDSISYVGTKTDRETFMDTNVPFMDHVMYN